MGPINNIPALVQIMAWRRPGDKPLSEAMMVSSLMHICITRPQWVKELQIWSGGYSLFTHKGTFKQVCVSFLRHKKYISKCLLDKQTMLTWCGMQYSAMFSFFNSLWPSNNTWQHGIWVNIGSGNGLLPDGTKPLPEPMSTEHQLSQNKVIS